MPISTLSPRAADPSRAVAPRPVAEVADSAIIGLS